MLATKNRKFLMLYTELYLIFGHTTFAKLQLNSVRQTFRHIKPEEPSSTSSRVVLLTLCFCVNCYVAFTRIEKNRVLLIERTVLENHVIRYFQLKVLIGGEKCKKNFLWC